MTNFFSKAALSKLGAALFTALFVIILTQDLIFPVTPLNRLEKKFIDYRFQERGPIDFKDSADVLILEITQDSYDQIPSPYNAWPWPRDYFASVIENLNEAGAKAIGIDIVMANPDKYSQENDTILFNAIDRFENVVVAGKIDIDAESAMQSNLGETIVKSTNENFSNIFYQADSSIGLVQAVSDQDGVYRRYVPYVYSQVNDKKIPTFAYAVLNKYFGNGSLFTAENKPDNFVYEGVEIPKYEGNTVLVNYYGSSGTFPRVKFIDVLDDRDFQTVDEKDFGIELNTWDNPEYGLKHSGIFKDKIVLIGSTMPEDKDLIPVSFSLGEREGDNLIYGVEYHANAAQNFLDRYFIYTLNGGVVFLILLILSTGLFYLTSKAKRIKIKSGFIAEIGIIAILVLCLFLLFELSNYFFSEFNLLIPTIDPALAIVFGYVGGTVFEFFVERKKSVMMRGMFSQYVPRSVVNELISNPDKLKLGGEKKILTMLFSDIAGFTSFSEGKSPEEVVTFINRFLDEMTESVLEFNGTLDKYLGDSVMAFWGAPIAIPDHAELACRSALEMKEKLKILNKEWSVSDQEINMRIGINTGEVVVGNIGGKKRFDYTVMGDNVNLASRLEGANKNYNTSIMLSEETNEVVKSKFVTRELDVVRVKGREKPTKIFELVDIRKQDNAYDFSKYYEGLQLYREGKFEQAVNIFEEIYSLESDNVAKSYIEKCEVLIANPPVGSWNGITTLTEK